MSGWGTSGNANRIKDTYIKGFLDISGGTLIVQKSSSLQIMANDSNNPRVEFKPGNVFTVNPGGFDVSYTALATLGLLGVSFENSTADINSRLKYITTSKTGISPNEIFSTNVGNSTTNSNLGVYGDINGYQRMFLTGDASFNGKLYVQNPVFFGSDLSLNGKLVSGGNAFFISDVSINGNVDIGSGSSSVVINKDISAGFALDVSGATILRNTLSVGSNVTFDGSLSVANITEPNPAGDCNLWTNSTGGNIIIGTQSATGLYLKGTVIDIQGGSGLAMTINTTGSIAITNSTGATAGFITGAKTVGVNIGTGNFTTANGIMSIFTGTDNDANSKLNIGTGQNNAGEINIATGTSRPLTSNTNIGGTVNLGSATSKTSVLGIMNVTNDASLNGNVKLGSGSRSVAINKDISAGYALDVSGLVILRNTMYVASDVSINGNLFVIKDSSFGGNLLVGGDLSLNSNLYVVKRALFSSDVSVNGNMVIGTGSRSVAINKDISAGYALDVSGLVILRNTMYVASDVSINGNLFVIKDSSFGGNLLVGGDLSLNNNLYVVKRALFSSDVSINGNVKMGSGSRSVAINKDISAGYALDVSGLVILRNTMYVASDVSINGNLFVIKDSSFGGNLLVGGDLSLNSNLYVVKRALFSSDVSINGNMVIGTGSRSVAINKDISAGYALDVSGLVILRNTMYVASDVSINGNLFVIKDSSFGGNLLVGGDLSLNSNLYVVKRALFSSDVSINGNMVIGTGSRSVAINKDISAGYALDVSGLVILRNTMYVASDVSINGNLFVIKDSSFGGNLLVGGDLSLNSNLYVVKRALFSSDVSINGNVKLGSGSRSVAINKDISAGFALDVSGLVILRNTMYVASDVSINGNLFVIKDSSFGGNLSVGGDLSLNSNLYVVKRALFSSDVSMLGNLDIGSGSSCLAINKDISAGYALDVSGLVILRNTMYVASDVSINGNLFVIKDSSFNGNLSVGGDLSLNSNLYVVKRALFSSDVSINGNVKLGSGSSLVAINKDISTGYALDVSGATMIRNTLYTGSIDTDISSGQIYLYDSLRHVTGNLYINTNSSSSASTRIGGGSIIIGGSGVTYLRSAATQPLRIGDNITAGGTVNLGTAVSKILVFGDASFNGNVKLGSGTNSVVINKDVSAGYALDVSGLVILRNTMYVASDLSLNSNLFVNRDSSFNGNLSVGGDLSLNSNLYVVKRSVFTLDVSMLGNLDIGTGSNSVAINKDISSSFALDVSGATKFRGAMDVAGVFTVNGAPVTGSGGASLTGNVQVGSNSGFVTIDKPYFFADPSLTIYYNFDTSINAGSGVQNIAKPGTYDGSFNVTAGSTTGMIDTTVFNNGKQNNTSLASFRNDPTINNFGIRIGTGTVPVSSTMTFSFWLYKKSRPAFSGGDWDRVFHFTDSTSQLATENNTIALDISAGGNIFPVITKGGGTPVSLITPSLPIVSYDLCTSAWNHVVWTINGTKSIIYINGSNAQTDTLSENITLNTSTQRNNGTIAYSYTTATGATRDFSGNIDDFRYYSNKALSYSEIYQLYNNNFYTFDICGGFLANGSSVIYEPVGSKASANSGSLTLLHGDASGSSSIMFKSVNDTLEYGYIQYEENAPGSTGYHFGLLTIGIENDGGLGSYTQQADRISLFPSGGTGFVGVNTKTPQTALDVSGQMRIYEGAGTTATATGGSLTLEHANTGGTSSLVFKASNSSTTSDYAYVQYQDHYSSNNPSIYKWDLNANTPWDINKQSFVSTGVLSTSLEEYFIDSSLNTLSVSLTTGGTALFGSPAYCISFNQTNVTAAGTSRINYIAASVNNYFNFSISLWIYPTFLDISNTYITVWSLSPSSGYSAELALDGNGRNLVFLFNNDSNTNNRVYTSAQAISFNTWYHVVCTLNSDSNIASMYLNGSLVKSTTMTSFTLISYNWFGLGCRFGQTTGTSAKGFRGAMCFVNIFSDELTQTEVSQLYATPGTTIPSTNNGLMTIGIENDTGYINGDNIVLWPCAGKGFVGINTKRPEYTLDVSGQIQASSYNATSDYRTKDNVMKLDTSFTVDGLNPVTYQFKPTGKQDVGFLAHEVQELYPFLVNGVKDGPNNQSLNYNGFIGILTKEIKDLKKKVLEQSAKALEQDARIKTLEQSAKALEKLVSDLINK